MDDGTVRALRITNTLFLVFSVLLLGCCIWLSHRYGSLRRKLDVDEKRFYDVVRDATTEFLSNITSNQNEVIEAPQNQDVSVAYRSFGTGSGYNGIDYVIINGDRYFVGDYIDEGLITAIQGGRFYVKRPDSSILVVRRGPASASASSPTGGGVAQQNVAHAADGGENSSDEQSGGFFSRLF